MCDFYDGDVETVTVFEWQRVRRARVQHSCLTCDKMIVPGAGYWRNFSVVNCKASTEKQCESCHEIGAKFGEEHQWTPSPSYLLECVRGCVDSDGPGSPWAPMLERIMAP